MAVPLFARYIAAVVGVLIVVISARSVIGTLIVPRAVSSWLTNQVDWVVDLAFRAASSRIRDHRRRDRVLASQVATLLLAQIVVWLLMFFLGFSLILWPLVSWRHHQRLRHRWLPRCGSSAPSGRPAVVDRAIIDLAVADRAHHVTLQIAYLPTLYSAFNRRETEVALLNARAGVPSWGPELLARTHYALGSGVSTIDTLPQLYADWERWAADVTESHTTYLPLVRFRSPRPLSSWVTALLATLDSAALILALSPQQAPTVPARMCLRSGFLCFREIGKAMGFDVPDEPDPAGGISLTYEEFLDAIARMRKVDFPIERDPEDAWPDFVGWRVNYEQAAYMIAEAVDSVPALWSGPRRLPGAPIAPIRPPTGPAAHRRRGQVARWLSRHAGAPAARSRRGHRAGPAGAGALETGGLTAGYS